jgi:hypothetical protein
MTSAELDALSTELRTQDNACTAHPLYCVYDHHLTGPTLRTIGTRSYQRWDWSHWIEAMTCRCRRGAVEVIDGKA